MARIPARIGRVRGIRLDVVARHRVEVVAHQQLQALIIMANEFDKAQHIGVAIDAEHGLGALARIAADRMQDVPRAA